MTINSQIVTLINSIISHGNHSHSEYTVEEFNAILFEHDVNSEEISSDALELIELYETLENEIEGDDFNVEFDGNEYRIISDSSIWKIYVETIKELVNDCYDLKLDKIPDFIAFDIDWEQTAKNTYADGYGHTFASYDGEESEAAGFWIFRTN